MILPKILITCTCYALSAIQVKLNEVSVVEDITIYSDNVNQIKNACTCANPMTKNHESLYHGQNKYLENAQGKRSVESAEVVEFSSV